MRIEGWSWTPNIGDTVTVAGCRMRFTGMWGSAIIVKHDENTFTIRWPWYWKLLNWVRERFRR